MSTAFKIFLGENNIRRIRVDSENPSYIEFTNLLRDLYPKDYHKELFLKWKDEEGDLITVSSEQEWHHLLQSVQERPIKLYITEGCAPYFKDGPPPQPVCFYKVNKEQITEEPQLLDRLKNSVPQCLQHLFQGDRILPYDLPEWAKEAISIKRLPLPGNEVDLDIDIPKLFEAMHKRALELLRDVSNTKFILEAKSLLQDMLTIVPKHAVTLYNLSCVESLLGHTKEAVKFLQSAIVDGGYNNVEHMMKDEDLANIRDTPEFQELVQSLQKTEKADEIMRDWTQVEEEKVEQPKVEEEKIEQPKVEKVEEVPISVGEHKWRESIDLLKRMGFGQNDPFFGPRCVGLLEQHNGDITNVLNALLQL